MRPSDATIGSSAISARRFCFVRIFAGFTQGMIRYVLNAIAVIIAFVLAAQLKDPILELLRFWGAFTPEGRELLIFWVLFAVFTIAGWFVIRALYHRVEKDDKNFGRVFVHFKH